jgi:hypothetical protein
MLELSIITRVFGDYNYVYLMVMQAEVGFVVIALTISQLKPVEGIPVSVNIGSKNKIVNAIKYM